MTENKAESDAHSRASEDKWKNVKFNKFLNRQTYNINTTLQKGILAVNDELNYQIHPFE